MQTESMQTNSMQTNLMQTKDRCKQTRFKQILNIKHEMNKLQQRHPDAYTQAKLSTLLSKKAPSLFFPEASAKETQTEDRYKQNIDANKSDANELSMQTSKDIDKTTDRRTQNIDANNMYTEQKIDAEKAANNISLQVKSKMHERKKEIEQCQ